MISNIHTIDIKPEELNLDHTLTPGQSFRWKQDSKGRWAGIIGNHAVIIWRENHNIKFRFYPDDTDESLITEYFRLEINLEDIYNSFKDTDIHIKTAINRFRGLRILRQDPAETLLSYICSAANSVSRISNAVEKLSEERGKFIIEIDNIKYYSFPSPEEIIGMDVNHTSKLCGLGFRCKNLHSTAEYLLQKPKDWLQSLKEFNYKDSRNELVKINGVGMKIADCVLLFSLDKDMAIPVDTHIRKVAVDHYLPEFRQKTLTQSVYLQISEYFQNKFGPYAGWAQEYLFYNDLIK